MERSKIIERLIEEAGYSKKAFAEKINMPPTTLRSILSRGVGNASVDNIIKVCKGLGITTDQLEEMAKKSNDKTTYSPELTAKDERDIQKELQKMIAGLEGNSSYAAFDGNNIEDLDPEDKELLISSLENSLKIAKKLAKQKYTPKKYRK